MDTYNKLSPKTDDQPIFELTKCIKQEYCDEDNNSERNFSPSDTTKVKQEDFNDCYTSVYDPFNNYVKVEAGVDLKDELENNLLRASNSECCSTKTDVFEIDQKDDVKILATEDLLTNVNTIENISSNSSLSQPAESNKEEAEGKIFGNKSFICNMCPKVCNTASDLTRHKRSHTGEKPYECDVCYMAFSTSSALMKHKRTHTGDKPYACDVCHKAFSISSNLAKHMRTHTGEKPYICDVCYIAFNVSSNLVKHKLTHTVENSHICDVCDKAFNTLSYLVRHKRIHTGEKRYVCDICDKAFNISSDLTRHKRIHTGEKPYACEFCHKVFATSSSLVRHKRLHTG